jgi:hypothetical protein
MFLLLLRPLLHGAAVFVDDFKCVVVYFFQLHAATATTAQF